ncbi:hypothetical protein LCGC14_2109750 [marine sediment metagenome]|uniref:Uncharacterized protein n=1 Tax=marine sediment metagenome TaxID=412755 RepID=A0A0F9E7L1_9ZZZZ
MGSILATELYQNSSAANHKLGEKYEDKWGRIFRYVQAGGSDLVTGNLLQEAVEATNFRSMNVAAAAAIGSTAITVDLGGTAVTANQFESGDLIVESSTGIGQNFKIVSHDVQTSTTGECTFNVDRPVAIALVLDTSQVSVRKNSYDGVIQYPITTQTGAAVGVAIVVISLTNFGWIQSSGDVSVLQDDGTNTSNGLTALVPSASVAGSVKLSAANGANVIGFSREIVNVDSTHGFAHLTID